MTHTRTAPRGRSEGGSALVIVVLAMGVLVTLGLALTLVATVDTGVAANVLDGAHALAVAEAAGARAMSDLAALPSWDSALDGRATSAFFDGDAGTRDVGGMAVHLGHETSRLLCGATTCVGRSPDDVTAARPWGRNNPRWRVFASGSAAALVGTLRGARPGYAVVWIGDDPAENDADPLRDGGVPVAGMGIGVNPGLDVVLLRIVGWGVRGSRRELELTVERADLLAHTGLRLRVWRELRGAEP